MAAETAYIADYLEQHKDEILDRWRDAARREQTQAERLSKMDDRELLDHLPTLTEALIRVLRGEQESLIEVDARRHGISVGSMAITPSMCSGSSQFSDACSWAYWMKLLKKFPIGFQSMGIGRS
jgi:RsbT co-antagonist protein rsbRD N-terminal domain